MRGMSLVGVALAVVSLLGQSQSQVTVSLDRGERYQTVEGYGAASAFVKPWMVYDGPFPEEVDMEEVGFYDTIISELGMTMFRIAGQGNIEQTPGVTDNPGYWSGTYPHIRGFKAAAERQNEPLRFISTSWSPPAWMKVNGEVTCGSAGHPNCVTTDCRLKPDMGPHLADYLVRYVRLLKDSADIDLYALSMQNEPAFKEPHGSCVMCPAEYRDLFKVVARRFRDDGLMTRFYGAEHCEWGWGVFEAAIRNDAEALGYMHAWATHAYTNGAHTESDTGAYDGPTATDKPLWQSETGVASRGLRHWPVGIDAAVTLGSALRIGRIATWLWWSLMNSVSSDIHTHNTTHCQMVNGQPTDKYYITSHYARFIRPGARQIKSESSDTSKVKVVAFYHEDHDCMSLVLTNPTASAATVSLSGANLPATFEKVTSTSAAKLQRTTVAGNEPISLPDSSVVTLVAGAYRNTGVADDTRVVAPSGSAGFTSPAVADAVRMEILTLGGRRVAVLDACSNATAPRRLPAGIYVRALVDAHGRVLRADRIDNIARRTNAAGIR